MINSEEFFTIILLGSINLHKWRRDKTTRIKLSAVLLIILIIVLGLGILLRQQAPPNTIRVACLGDSTTASTEFSDYPKILQSMLGTNYLVGNFGVITATVLLNTNKPYINQSAFVNAQNFKPNIIVIMLGTNDAQVNNYLSIDKFKHDYEELINRISASTSNARIFVVKPPPIFKNTLNLSNTNLVEGVIPRIEQLSNERSLPLIDVYDILINHPECFADGVHPNHDGARIIANEIYGAIVNDS